MVQKKEWKEFRETGLVLFINQFLHIFGWAIVFEFDDKTDEIVRVYPGRVKFRGFDNNSTEQAYKKLSQYMEDNSKEINEEAQQ